MASNNSLFASLTDSEIRIFQNHSRSPARGLKLLNKSIFTEENVTEFAKTVKLMIKAARSSNTLAPKSQMEVFGQKLYDSFATKRIHLKVAVDFLMLQQHISDFLPLHVEPPPSPLPPLKDYSSDDDTNTETPLTWHLRGEASLKLLELDLPARRDLSVRPRDLPGPEICQPRDLSAQPRDLSARPRDLSARSRDLPGRTQLPGQDRQARSQEDPARGIELGVGALFRPRRGLERPTHQKKPRRVKNPKNATGLSLLLSSRERRRSVLKAVRGLTRRSVCGTTCPSHWPRR